MDGDHSIQRLNESLKAFKDAESKVKEIAAFLRRAAEALDNPEEAGVSDPTGIIGEARTRTGAHTLDASKWPTIKEIDTAIREYQKAVVAGQGAYDALSAEDKALVGNLRD